MITWIKRLFFHSRLLKKLPPLEGKILEYEPLARKTWFGVGGEAEIYFEPASISDLQRLIKKLPDVPLNILGAGSNVLVLDGGVPGITIHLGKPFSEIKCKGDIITCGAGVLVKDLAKFAEKNKLSGFEFLSGIPGTVGGAIRMNAGAYGFSFSDRLQKLLAMTGNGDISEIFPQEMLMFEYRKCYLPEDWIFLEVELKGKKVKDAKVIQDKMLEYKKKREASQPQGVKTAGSTFKNPTGLTAGQLIEKAGLKGCRVGGAVVSTKHANFLINDKGATARDIEILGEKIRKKVKKQHGVRLDWEVKKIGVHK